MIRTLETRTEAAHAAATAVANELRRLIGSRGRAVAIFDALTYSTEFFDHLISEPDIDWTQVIVFQAGEYVGEGPDSQQSSQRFLTEHLILRVPIVSFQPMRGDAPNSRAAAANFAERLIATPPDIAFVSFELLDAMETNPHSDDIVAFTTIRHRLAFAITLPALLRCPRLFALGVAPAPHRVSEHPDASIFAAINP